MFKMDAFVFFSKKKKEEKEREGEGREGRKKKKIKGKPLAGVRTHSSLTNTRTVPTRCWHC